MPTSWIEFHYKDSSFDFKVPDVDFMQLLDLIIDIGKAALEQNVLVPNVFEMHYKSRVRKNKIVIKSDLDLFSMFDELEGMDTIEIWLTDTETPIKEFGLAFELKRQKEAEERKQRELEEAMRREKKDGENLNIMPLTVEIPVFDIVSNATTYVCVQESQFVDDDAPQTQATQTEQPPHSCTNARRHDFATNQTSFRTPQNQFPFQTPQNRFLFEAPQNQSPFETPCTQTQLSQKCPTSDRFFEGVSEGTSQTNQNQTKQQDEIKKKMPATTARRKGLYVPKSKQVGGNEGEATEGRPKRRSITSNAQMTLQSDSDDSPDKDFNLSSEDKRASDEDESESDAVDSNSDGAESDGGERHPFDMTLDMQTRDNGDETEDEGDGVHLIEAYTNAKMYVHQKWGEITLRRWTLFVDKYDLLDVLSDYCIQEGFSLVVIKSDPRRYTAECAGEKCTWRIHASKLADKLTWAIKSITGLHVECFKLQRNPMATSEWMCKKLLVELKAHPKMPVKSMSSMLMSKFGIEVSLRTMYKVRNMALDNQFGAHEKSYSRLAAYGEMIKETNPGSWTLITWHKPSDRTDEHFKAMFVGFSAWITGFLQGCRPIIGVDGCHLKGRYTGVLLSALSLDANNNLYLIAYAIVGKENTETWRYFFRNLKIAFERQRCLKWDWTFISDRMKGIEPALDKEFPLASKRICAQHLYTNFKAKFGGPAYYTLFWKAANATSSWSYNQALDQMSRMSPSSMKYLLDVPQQWSMCHFDPKVACHHNTSNFVESFNALINDIRELPVYSLMEGIRTYYMDKYAERIDLAESMELTDLTPYAKGIVETHCQESWYCTVIKAGRGEFEVRDRNATFVVDIFKGTCACGGWQVTGMPCRHACRAIYHNKEEPIHYVHGFYSGQCYKLTYSDHMHPVPDKEQWPMFDFPDIKPPIQEKGVGRPARKRKRTSDELNKKKGKRSTTITCSICGHVGHNARGCQGGPTRKEKAGGAAAGKKKRAHGAGTSAQGGNMRNKNVPFNEQ